MAELDQFFAKKDKRKPKAKNFSSTDEIAKRLDETEKRLEKELQKETPVKKAIEPVVGPIDEDKSTIGTTPVIVNEVKDRKKEEEEWNDFEDKGPKDLTDLKISRLQMEDEEDGMGGGGCGEDGDEDGNGDDRKVWKTEKQPIPAVIQEDESSAVEEPKPAAIPSTTGGSYVPPHFRNVQASTPSSREGYRKSKAPDINNEMAFPSLSDATAANPAGAWGRKGKYEDRGFENVRHGSSRSAQDGFSTPKLSTANRFDALTDHS